MRTASLTLHDQGFKLIFLAALIVATAIRARWALPTKRLPVARDWGSRLDLTLLIVATAGMLLPLLYIATPWLDFADYALPNWAGWCGIPWILIGLGIIWRAHADLGRNFAPTPLIRETHALVTTGVYARMRHPMYAAHIYWSVGQALLLQNWIAGLAMPALMLPLCIFRVPVEERMMHDTFGDAYAAYVARSWRFFPKPRT